MPHPDAANEESCSMSNSEKAHFIPKGLLKEIRSRFAFVESDPQSGKRIFLDSASGSLRLKSMLQARMDQSQYPDQLGRLSLASRHADEVMAKGFQDVRDFLGTPSGTIMPGMSSTHAVYRVVNAVLASAPGTNVVTTDLDHPSVYDATAYFAKEYGKQWRIAHLDPETGFVNPEAILENVDEQTALVALIHGSNTTGTVLDIKHVAAACRDKNPDVFVLADGVQFAPHAAIDVQDLGVDAYVFGPYKIFCAKGIGFAFLSDRLARLKHWSLAGKAGDDWILGSPDDSLYAAWSAVVDYLVWLGAAYTDSTDKRTMIVAAMNACEKHGRSLLKRCLHGAGSLPGLLAMDHVRVHGMTEELSHRFCLMLLSFPKLDAKKAACIYNKAGIHVHYRVPDAYSAHTLSALGIEGAVRLSPCHYNTPEEIDAFLETTLKFAELSDAEIANIEEESGHRSFGEG